MGLFIRKKIDGGISVSSTSDGTGPPPERHHFGTRWVTENLVAGAISLSDGAITIHAEDGDVVYDIERGPGAYCCHCGDKVGDGAATSRAESDKRRAYVGQCKVANNDKDTGDPSNPAGYEIANYYLGVLRG